MQIKFMMVKEASEETIKKPDEVAALMTEEGKIDRECFWVLHLNTNHRLIEKELVSVGILNSSIVGIPETFRKSILNCAASILSIHNHPSGNTTPSREDIKLWKRLNEAGKLIGIPAIDHIIITPSGEYYSWTENK